MYKVFFPINLRKIRTAWKRSAGATQAGFAGYTRTQIQTYEDYRVDAPFDLVLWLSEQTGISCHDLLTRELLTQEIPQPKTEVTLERTEMEERKKRRIEGLN